ncbi:MAG: MBOAT family protein [Planctomycetes bacterium]|nr:MBOAT family protein [Planctomycetota bacterium]
MAFNSLDYIFFFLIVYLIHRCVTGASSYRNLTLFLASLFFYAWWSPIHVLLLLYSGISDYWIARFIDQSESTKRKRLLALSIFNNLSLLFFYKYLSALSIAINDILNYTPITYRLFEIDLVLPVGISFYTFQTMSYSFDVYRKHIKALDNKIDFMLYVAFFPQLVAGPILRARQFIPQLHKPFSFNKALFFTGLTFILWGLMKKICIADPLGILLVDPVYNAPGSFSSLDILLATYAYGFQVYNDFSGYSDIAIGSALILGYQIPINFDRPFLCLNPRDFWNRWHISLSHWVRDYVFYPFHSRPFFKKRIRFNLFITIVLIGIWHGARLTYLAFGLWHGLLSVIHSKWHKSLPKGKSPHFNIIMKVCSWLIFWHCLTIGFCLFRAEDLPHAYECAKYFLQFESYELTLYSHLSSIFICSFLAIITHFVKTSSLEQIGEKLSKAPIIISVILVWLFMLFFMHFDYFLQGHQAFIYFQF